jgi:putative ABC transport system permease protein
MSVMEHLWQDLRYALRTFAKQPTFALTAILTLALGIGANAAIFGVVNSVLLRPLPFPEPDELAVLWGHYPDFGRTSTSAPDFRDWREGIAAFEHLSAFTQGSINLAGGGEPEQVRGARVTANFFQTLGVAPALGRTFVDGEDREGAPDVAVIGDGLWRRRFAADPAMVGRAITINDRPFTVAGVMPPGFTSGGEDELWIPLDVENPGYPRRGEFLTVIGRLRPGATVAQAQSQLDAVVRRLAQQYPETNASIQGEVVSMQADLVREARPALLIFTGAVALVLLIACANVANLLLARASARQREVAVRLALGASRGRLVRQLLTESVLLAVIGAAAGLVLAAWALDALRASGTTFVPRLTEIRIDWMVAGYSLALAVGTGILFGLAPAVRLVSAHGLPAALKEGARGATAGGLRLRNALVLGEAALAIVLLAGAGLLLRSFVRLNQVDMGFDPRGVLTYELILPTARYPDEATLVPMIDRLVERTRGIPGVNAVAVSSDLPLESTNYLTFDLEGRVDTDGSGDLQPFRVTPEHFAVLGIPLRSGRLLAESDDASAPAVAVVNEELVRRFLGGQDPIGRRIQVSDGADSAATIVGVVGDVAQEGVSAAPYAQVYQPIAQGPTRSVRVAIRTAGEPLAIANQARAALAAVDPQLPLTKLRTMEDRLAGSLTQPRVSMAVLGVFALLALVLAAIGIYGVLSYAIARRTREIGIRIALGAQPGDVRRLVIGQGMRPVVGGVLLGVGGALLLTRLMQGLLYGVSPSDPGTLAGVALLLSAVALFATWLPARRATRVDALEALRSE